jgi:hypothetical protein
MTEVSESIQIHLDSYYATTKRNNNAADCVYQLPIISTERDVYLHLSVVSMSIPYSFYNINTSNNIFRYNLITGAEVTITIPVGNYNIKQLLSHLNNVMGNNMNITYDSITNKVTISNPNISFVIIYNDFTRILGYSASNFYTQSTTSPYCVNLFTITNINVESNLMTYNYCNVPSESTNQTILANIPVNTQPQGLITYENKSGYKTNLYVGELSVLEIRLKDNRGNLIDMNGCDYTLSIQIDTIPF